MLVQVFVSSCIDYYNALFSLSTGSQDPIQILTLTYRAIHGQAPAYPSQILLPYSSARPLRGLHHKIRFNLNLWLRAYLSYTH